MSEEKRQRPAGRAGNGDRPRFRLNRRTVGALVGLLVLNYIIVSMMSAASAQPRVEIPYRPTFLAQVHDGNVAAISAKGTTVEGSFKRPVRYPDAEATATTNFETEVPEFANRDELDRLLQANGVKVTAEPTSSETPLWLTLLIYVGPTLLLFGFFYWYMRRAGGGAGQMFSFGRSKAKQYEPTKEKVTFADIAGIDDAEQELAEVVDFLREPGQVPEARRADPARRAPQRRAGNGEDAPRTRPRRRGRRPVLLDVGVRVRRDDRRRRRLARARPVCQGQGRRAFDRLRRRDRRDRPLTRQRGSSGANDEREQTLNQILTEMDGFDASTGVIVLAATNRPDVLDAALLRPGRFDRRVTIQPPDKDGRAQILRVHSRSVPLAADVDLDALAATTVGMVGADLANLVNEAALLAARRGHDVVHMTDFSDSLEKIVLGAERKLVMSDADRRRTAYHEAGHALVGMLTPGADPVRKISIIPRSKSLGVTLSAPETDRFNYDKQALLARIRVTTGGRAAEEVVFGDETTGAENDIRQVTELARLMVGRFGMSDEIGFVAVLPQDGDGYPWTSQASERTRQRIDDEVKRIVGEAHDDAIRLLSENRNRLDSLAEALVRAETLDQAQAHAAAGLTTSADDTAAEELAPAVGM